MSVRILIAILLVCFAGIGLIHLAAQGATATILATVTDSTGAVIPDVAIQVKNVGTGQPQTTQTDAAGRYNAPNLGIGEYEVQATREGFSTVVHKGITLTVGSQNVVDFSLAIGQAQQTVTVEGEVTQVETTNAAVGALVDQRQMRELPLNGRNFEQLIQLAPGVQSYYATSLNMRQGKDISISVAGGRPEGTALLMDDQNLQNFYNHGIGSITGTSLGVESIGEFQTLTNTYGAQFGGNGAVMNAVTRSGTNALHGSLYEFLRNSALDARNFTDPSEVPAFRRNQFGGSLGGPIRKDKAFFFFNYEGIRLVQGFSQVANVPLARTSTSTNPATAAAINGVLALYPGPTFNINPAAGTGQATVVKNQTAHENYYLGRFDYNFSEKDSFLGRYFIDLQDALYPFHVGNVDILPEHYIGTNQGFDRGERNSSAPTVINTVRGSFSRTNVFASPGEGGIHTALQMFPGSGRSDASITVPGLTTIGTMGGSPQPAGQVQNHFVEGDDLAWTHGAHSFRFGGYIDRVQSSTLWTFQGPTSWTFSSIPAFLAGTARMVIGVTDAPNNYPIRNFREIDFALYAQDDWKVTRKLTVNLGLRYQPTTNPVELRNNLYAIGNYATDTAFTNVPHAMISNPSGKNFDPRVGVAYDPFGDHKTSIRAGFGIFHEVLYPGVWAIGFINAPPWTVLTQVSPPGTNTIPYQVPGIAGGAKPLTGGAPPFPSISTGYAWQIDRTPYMIQYNFNIQREVVAGTVFSVGYVGSHGVNLITGSEQNPVPYSVDARGVYHFAATNVGSQRINPRLAGFSLGVSGTTSRYDSLQAALNRRLTRNVQAQVSYTYSKCLGTGDATLATLGQNVPTLYSNPHYWQADYSVCGFSVTQALRVNSLVALPFHKNRLVAGWQLSGILTANSGLPFNISDGVDQSNQVNGQVRPDYAPNNPASGPYPACNNHPYLRTVALWFNPNCFVPQAYGTLGNLGREALYGPGMVNLDFAVLKSTKIRENMDLQFRAELFNLLNHTNLSFPTSLGGAMGGLAIFTGTPSPTTTLGRVPSAGQILTYASPSREIQFGLKLIF
jgi:hypothetical protein